MCYGKDHQDMRVTASTEERRERAVNLAVAALFVAVAALAALDLLLDLQEGTTLGHAAVEGAVVVVGLAGAGWMASRVRAIAREAQELRLEAAASRAEAARWRDEAGDLIRGLSAAIDRQLERWGLTDAEKEIALLLLKGLSHKEIAAIRGVGETTVRQQARALYRKAGLTGRHDLAAFFLEDLLGPPER
jgi:DNA-binding CsgD family transcriptional regulator